LIIKTTKYLIKIGKSQKESIQYLFYGLLYVTVGLFGNAYFNNYNEDPIIENTQIEIKTIDGEETMLVHDVDTTYVIQQPDKDKAPIIKEIKKTVNNDEQPIKLL
jgi:hypothetical protein